MVEKEQFREDVPSPTPFKRPSGEIREILKRLVNPNKGIEDRISRLEAAVWFFLIADILTRITIFSILYKW